MRGSEGMTVRPHAPVSALVALGFGPAELGAMTVDFLNELGEDVRDEILTTPLPADRPYVIYWPGVLEIPWPTGMTAQQAVTAWRAECWLESEGAYVHPSVPGTDVTEIAEWSP